ncbi:MAG: 30S ribosomal protein S17 [bacterium]
MKERGIRKKRIGIVVSNKMDKTVVVSVERRVMEPTYKKILRRHKKFKVHDQNNECMIGDKVLIVETRHLSKDKYFRVKSILEKSKAEISDNMGKK